MTKTMPRRARPPVQLSGSRFGQMVGQITLLELVRKHLESDQQEKQVGERHPFMFEMPSQGGDPVPGGKSAHQRFVDDDDRQPDDRDGKRALVHDRDAQKHQAEKIEFHGSAEQSGRPTNAGRCRQSQAWQRSQYKDKGGAAQAWDFLRHRRRCHPRSHAFSRSAKRRYRAYE